MSNQNTTIDSAERPVESAYSRLVADIGGTHARFALVDNSPAADQRGLVEVKVFKCADFDGPAETFIAYQNYLGHSLPERACVAAAGPVSGNEVSFTNLNWHLSAKDLRKELNLKKLQIVNDFTAVAHAVSALHPQDVKTLYAAETRPGGRQVVLGAGTGLGVAALNYVDGAVHVIDSEAGHSRFSPANAEQRELLRNISRGEDYVSMEMLLAGPGIPRIHEAVCAIHGLLFQPMSAEEITSHARNETDASCQITMELYVQVLAGFCSNLALTFGARGGLYLAGDVLRALEPLLLHKSFIKRYLDAGIMSEYVEQTPLSLVLVQDPGLRGAAVCNIS